MTEINHGTSGAVAKRWLSSADCAAAGRWRRARGDSIGGHEVKWPEFDGIRCDGFS